MDGDVFGRLAYLALLGTVLISILLLRNRNQLGHLLQQAVIWALIFVGLIAAVGLWPDIRQTVMPRQTIVSDEGRIVVPRAHDGHFYMVLDIEGEPINFMVDTGASSVVLSRADARQVGIDPEELGYYGRARTANGTVRTARVQLSDVALGDMHDRGVTAWVNEQEMDISLLGMSYLERFATIEISNNQLVLRR